MHDADLLHIMISLKCNVVSQFPGTCLRDACERPAFPPMYHYTFSSRSNCLNASILYYN